MEWFAITEAQRLAKQEQENRRKLRIIQVRQQTADWMIDTRRKYENEKNNQIQQIIEDVAEERQHEVIDTIQKIVTTHEEGMQQIGTAHRAAQVQVELRDEFNKMLEIDKMEQNQLALKRHKEALKSKRQAIVRDKENIQQVRELKDKVRRQENLIARELVIMQPFGTESTVPSRAQPVTKRDPRYQQSPTRYLHVPSSGSKQSTSKVKERSKKKPAVAVVLKEQTHLPAKKPLRPSTFELVANERAAGVSTPTLKEIPYRNRKLHKERESRGEVLFFDAAIPQPPKIYRPPSGLVEHHTEEIVRTSAWREGASLAKASKQKQSHEVLDAREMQRRAEIRGKRALKIARLEQRYKKLAADLIEENIMQALHPVPECSQKTTGYNDDVRSSVGSVPSNGDLTDFLPSSNDSTRTMTIPSSDEDDEFVKLKSIAYKKKEISSASIISGLTEWLPSSESTPTRTQTIPSSDENDAFADLKGIALEEENGSGSLEISSVTKYPSSSKSTTTLTLHPSSTEHDESIKSEPDKRHVFLHYLRKMLAMRRQSLESLEIESPSDSNSGGDILQVSKNTSAAASLMSSSTDNSSTFLNISLKGFACESKESSDVLECDIDNWSLDD